MNGKIVKKEWLESCHKDRKRFPWRRFCLDPADKGQESEEEIWEADLLPSASAPKPSASATSATEDLDTDEEIERIRLSSKNETAKNEDNFEMDTDVEIEKIRGESAKPAAADAFEMDTDEELEKIEPEKSKRADSDGVDSDEAYAAETGATEPGNSFLIS